MANYRRLFVSVDESPVTVLSTRQVSACLAKLFGETGHPLRKSSYEYSVGFVEKNGHPCYTGLSEKETHLIAFDSNSGFVKPELAEVVMNHLGYETVRQRFDRESADQEHEPSIKEAHTRTLELANYPIGKIA